MTLKALRAGQNLIFNNHLFNNQGFPDSSVGKESACNAGDLSSIPVLGRSPGEGKGYPLQYCGLENSMEYTVHGVKKSWTRLSDFHFTILYQIYICFVSNSSLCNHEVIQLNLLSEKTLPFSNKEFSQLSPYKFIFLVSKITANKVQGRTISLLRKWQL